MTRPADPGVLVAVIARAGEPLDPCLAALERAGVPDPHVVRVRDRAGGLSDARNRALAACRDEEVLALVEDDVAVGPAWLDGVLGAFAPGPGAALRACAGGPLTPRLDDPPAWLSGDVVAGLPLLPLAGPERDLAPAERTFPGGNVAFRAAALRGVGGFWPARGHPLARDPFGEDHFAQHELAAAGWTARLVPGLAAERLVEGRLRRRDVLGARLRYGARLTLVGDGRPRAEAGRVLALAAAGTLPALLRRDPARAMARAARAAENLGVLLAARIGHDDLQPAVRRTPFRDSVPPPARRRTWAARPARAAKAAGPRTAILLYHRVADVADDPLALAVSPRNFAEQLEVVGDRLVPLDDVVAGTAPDGAIAITFDDGYLDVLEHAAPALAGRPATLYVTTGATVTQQPFWWDVVAASHPTRAGDRAWPPGSPTARRHLHAYLQARPPEEIAALIAGLDGRPGGRAMTRDELRRAAEAFDLGAHTRTHRSLAWAHADVQRAELTGSADDLARWTGRQPRTCSYPFGIPGSDVDATTRRVAREAGFAAGVVNAPGLVTPASDRFALPRLSVPDAGGAAFAAWLDPHWH